VRVFEHEPNENEARLARFDEEGALLGLVVQPAGGREGERGGEEGTSRAHTLEVASRRVCSANQKKNKTEGSLGVSDLGDLGKNQTKTKADTRLTPTTLPNTRKNKQTETHLQRACARNATGTSRLRKIPRRPRRQQSTQLPQPQSRRPRLPRRKQPLSRRQQQQLLLPLRRHQHRRQPSPKQQRPFPRIARHVQSSRTNK